MGANSQVCHAVDWARRIGYVKVLLVSLGSWWIVFGGLFLGAQVAARK